MDITRIRTRVEEAERLLEQLAPDADPGIAGGTAGRQAAWKNATDALSVAWALSNVARVRHPDQAFLRRVVQEHIERLTRELHEVEL